METIALRCPLCAGKHSYEIKVERSIVFKHVTSFDLDSREKPKPVSVTRLFNCPNKNDMFQAVLRMFETSSSKIECVTVIGLADGK
jgi:hypothetical protein